MRVKKGHDPGRVVFRQVAQPPGDGLLDEPVAVRHIARRPAQHTVARGGLIGAWVVGFRQIERRDQRRPPGPHVVGLRPAFYHVQPGGIGLKPAPDGAAGMIGNGPGVELRHPGLQQIPDRVIGPDPRLSQQLTRRNPRFVDVAVPKVRGKRNPLIQRQILAPIAGQVVQRRIGHTQIDARCLVIGGGPFGPPRFDMGAHLIQRALQIQRGRHSTVTDLAKLRGWSTSVPLATAV